MSSTALVTVAARPSRARVFIVIVEAEYHVKYYGFGEYENLLIIQPGMLFPPSHLVRGPTWTDTDDGDPCNVGEHKLTTSISHSPDDDVR